VTSIARYSCCWYPSQGGYKHSLLPPDKQGFQRSIDAILHEEHVPGASVALVDSTGLTWLGSFGTTRAGGQIAVDRDTVFCVGSVGKSMVALTLIRLEEEGRLKLDTPVQDVAPGLTIINQWQEKAP
jgi:CubicO group peptidase (beta-lactamase class C family)